MVLGGADFALRPLVILPIILLLPGMALVRLLDLREPVLELTLGIATSVALATLAASATLYAGAWAPDEVLVGLAVVALTASWWELRQERLRLRPRRVS
jgi:hypothetical protein